MFPALIGLTAAAAASAAAYQSMAPSAQWYGQTFAGGMPGSKQIVLTYDDGPNDPHTLRLLDVLAKKGAPLFFGFNHAQACAQRANSHNQPRMEEKNDLIETRRQIH